MNIALFQERFGYEIFPCCLCSLVEWTIIFPCVYTKDMPIYGIHSSFEWWEVDHKLWLTISISVFIVEAFNLLQLASHVLAETRWLLYSIMNHTTLWELAFVGPTGCDLCCISLSQLTNFIILYIILISSSRQGVPDRERVYCPFGCYFFLPPLPLCCGSTLCRNKVGMSRCSFSHLECHDLAGKEQLKKHPLVR